MLLRDDLVDPLGRPLDLARLVGDDVVVVVLARQLERGVALADLELVGGLGRPARSRWKRSSSDGGTMKTRSASGTLLLDDLRRPGRRS